MLSTTAARAGSGSRAASLVARQWVKHRYIGHQCATVQNFELNGVLSGIKAWRLFGLPHAATSCIG